MSKIVGGNWVDLLTRVATPNKTQPDNTDNRAAKHLG